MKRMKFIHLRDCFRYILAIFAFGGAKRIVPNMTVPWHISKPQSLVLHSDLLDMPLTEKVGPGQHRCWSKVTNQGWMPLKKESMGNNWNKWKRCKQSRPNIASIFFIQRHWILSDHVNWSATMPYSWLRLCKSESLSNILLINAKWHRLRNPACHWDHLPPIYILRPQSRKPARGNWDLKQTQAWQPSKTCSASTSLVEVASCGPRAMFVWRALILQLHLLQGDASNVPLGSKRYFMTFHDISWYFHAHRGPRNLRDPTDPERVTKKSCDLRPCYKATWIGGDLAASGSMALGSFWLHVLWAEASRSMSCHRTVCIRMRQSIQQIFQNKFDLLWPVVLCTASSLPPTEKACSDASTDECSSFLQAGCHGLARMARVEDLKFRETSPHWPTRQLNSRRNSWNVRTCSVYSTSNVVCLQI